MGGVPEDQIAVDDPRVPDISEMLERHLAFTHSHSPPEDVHALDVDGLLDASVTFFSVRRTGLLLGVGALKELDALHGELKSMHVAEASRGHGIGRTLVGHLVAVARHRRYRRVSLETGSMAAFAAARTLYTSAGFLPCAPFGDYRPSANSVFMTMTLDD
jgi:putative acetyltransferase